MGKYLENNVKNQENAIEEIVCKEIDKGRKVPLDGEKTIALMNLLLIKEEIQIPEGEKPHLYKIIESRVTILHDYKLSNNLILFLAMLCQTPGKAILIIWYFQYLSKIKNIKEFDLNSFCLLFPNGFYSDEFLSKIWQSQKIEKSKPHSFESDNLIDYSSAGFSINTKRRNDPEVEI